MKKGVNLVILIGNLGADPDVRYMPNGDQVTTVRLATTDKWKDKQSGETREATEWHRVVFYRKLAEIVGQYTKKGSQLYVEGRIRTRKWQDKDGQDRYTTEIEATEMQMLGGGRGDGIRQGGDDGGGVPHPPAPHQVDQQKPASTSKSDIFDGIDDDIPF